VKREKREEEVARQICANTQPEDGVAHDEHPGAGEVAEVHHPEQGLERERKRTNTRHLRPDNTMDVVAAYVVRVSSFFPTHSQCWRRSSTPPLPSSQRAPPYLSARATKTEQTNDFIIIKGAAIQEKRGEVKRWDRKDR